jgi:hypothetical protein
MEVNVMSKGQIEFFQSGKKQERIKIDPETGALSGQDFERARLAVEQVFGTPESPSRKLVTAILMSLGLTVLRAAEGDNIVLIIEGLSKRFPIENLFALHD